MITENLSTLKIHKLTAEQYKRAHESGNIDPSAWYLTPDTDGTYYMNLAHAVDDINNGVTTNSTADLSASKVKLSTSDTGRTIITLLDNLSENSRLDVYKDVDLVLNGKTLNFEAPSARLKFFEGTNCTINGEIEGSQVTKTSSDNSTNHVISSIGESLCIQGGTYSMSGSFDNNMVCIAVSSDVKTFRVRGCTVNSINTSNIEGASRTRAIQAVARNSFIEDSTILADGMQVVQAILTNGRVELNNSRVDAITRNTVSMVSATAVYNNATGTCVINNCVLHGDAPFDDAEHPCAEGLTNYGTAILNNTDVTGTINGFGNHVGGHAYINGGTFTGYSHGGFYLAHGIEGTAHINDATIRCGNYDGIFDYSNSVLSASGYSVAPLASMYVGGGEYENNSNITAYMDGCTFDGPGSYSLVLRGSSDERNITVNISNSTIANGKPVRIDNSTHKLNVGVGNTFTAANIDYSQYAQYTGKLYRRVYNDACCLGSDYNTLVELSYNNTDRYYTSLYHAVTDLSSGAAYNSLVNLSTAKVKVTTADNGGLLIVLLDDVTETEYINIDKDVTLVLNGKTLFLEGLNAGLRFLNNTCCSIDGTVNGSRIVHNCPDGSSYRFTIAVLGKKLSIHGGMFEVTGSFDKNIGFLGTGTNVELVEMDGCEIKVINTSISHVNTRALQASALKSVIRNSRLEVNSNYYTQGILSPADTDVTVLNSTIKVNTDSSEVAATAYAILNRGTVHIKDSNLFADAVDCHAYVAHSIAIHNTYKSRAFCENVELFGTHSGIDNSEGAELYINGGIYTGYCHGGVYCAHGADGIAYINDAILNCGNYTGVHDYSAKGDEIFGALYVGGGEAERANNIVVYMDGCTFGELGYSIVMRGSDKEKNNTLNISNSTVVEGRLRVRIDSSTHKVNVGTGTNITTESIDYPQYAKFTNKFYRRLHSSTVCDGDDYAAMYNHYFDEKSSKTEFILNSSTEGSTKRFRITIDDDGVLTATEIVETATT